MRDTVYFTLPSTSIVTSPQALTEAYIVSSVNAHNHRNIWKSFYNINKRNT